MCKLWYDYVEMHVLLLVCPAKAKAGSPQSCLILRIGNSCKEHCTEQIGIDTPLCKVDVVVTAQQGIPLCHSTSLRSVMPVYAYDGRTPARPLGTHALVPHARGGVRGVHLPPFPGPSPLPPGSTDLRALSDMPQSMPVFPRKIEVNRAVGFDQCTLEPAGEPRWTCSGKGPLCGLCACPNTDKAAPLTKVIASHVAERSQASYHRPVLAAHVCDCAKGAWGSKQAQRLCTSCKHRACLARFPTDGIFV